MRSQFIFKPPQRIERNPTKDEAMTFLEYEKSIAALEEAIANQKNKVVRQALEKALEDVQAKRDALKYRIDKEEGKDVESTPMPSSEGSTRKRGRGVAAPTALFKEQENNVVEEEMILRWTDELNNIVVRGLAPLMRVLGIVATRLRYDDVRPLLVYKKDATIQGRLAVVEPASTVEAFIERNSHVGNKLLYAYISTYQPSKEESVAFESMKSDCFDLDTDNVDEFRTLISNANSRRVADARKRARVYMERQVMERAFAPAWAFEVMSSGIFRAVLSITSFGAFEAATAQVRRIPGCSTFTLKELICSPSVSDQFGFLVASTYLASGDDISGSVHQRGRHSKHSTYLNLMAMRNQLAESIYTAKIWFESVYAAENPILRQFELEKQKRLDAFRPRNKDDFVEYIVRQMNLHKDTQALEKANQLTLFVERTGAEDMQPYIDRVRESSRQLLDPQDAAEYDLAAMRIVGQYTEFWNRLFARDEEFRLAKCNGVLKEILAANLDKYKDMLPKRELVYRG